MLILVGSNTEYDFWAGFGDDYGKRTCIYNITPTGGLPPAGGYLSKAYVENLVGVRFPLTEVTQVHFGGEIGVIVLDWNLHDYGCVWAPIPEWWCGSFVEEDDDYEFFL